jgi:hypothetical protein
MKLGVVFYVVALALLPACSSMSTGDGRGAEAAHHPAGVASADPHAQQMKAMQEMHQKMAAAKTPEERAALMKDHMKAMQDGMAMMGPMRGGMMHGGRGHMDAETMKRRMDMMEMMMQMMMDREGMKPPGAR